MIHTMADKRAKKVIKHLRYILEAILLYPIYYAFYLMPIDAASAVAGWLVEKLGYRLSFSNIARNNIKLAMPELTETQREAIIKGMLNNLGRMVGESPHLHRLSTKEWNRRVEIEGKLDKNIKKGIVISAHIANFEIGSRLAKELGIKLNLIYRPANNPLVNTLINSHREGNGMRMLKKGMGGMRGILKAFKNNEFIGLLADQKMNDGIKVPFFNRDANTTPAPANLAIRHGASLIMMQIIRKKGAYYKIKLYPPIKAKSKDTEYSMMLMINSQFENWIREHPEQWFWVHNRWGKPANG